MAGHTLIPSFVAFVLAVSQAGGPLLFDFSGAGRADPHPGWELKVKEGEPGVSLIEAEGRKSLCLKSRNSSFSIQRKINVDVRQHRYISWRWRVDRLPAGGDLRKDNKDDQAAQLFVAFGDRKSISYVWDTAAPVGATGRLHIPLVMDVRIVAVESGAGNIGKWVTVTRNVFEDYRRLFGSEPPHAEGLRFQINTQHTGGEGQSCLEFIKFRDTP